MTFEGLVVESPQIAVSLGHLRIEICRDLTGIQVNIPEFIIVRLEDLSFHARRQDPTPLWARGLLAKDERSVRDLVDGFVDLGLDLLILRLKLGSGGSIGLKLGRND
jgi:hypothetical protein